MTRDSGATERIYLPRPTLALAVALICAGASAGWASALYMSHTNQAIQELREQSARDARELKQEVCLLRSQMKATGFTVVCRGEYNLTSYSRSTGTTISYATERTAGMTDRQWVYVAIAAFAVLNVLALLLVRDFGRWVDGNRKALLKSLEAIEASEKSEAWSRELIGELQRQHRHPGPRLSPVSGYPSMDPEHLRERGGL